MESNPRPPDRPVDLTPGDPLASLHRWIAEGQVDEAARARTRQRWLEKAAAEEATLGGVLVDLAERQRPVTIRTIDGHRVTGPVVAVGADFGIVREPRLGDALIPTRRIGLVRPAPGENLPTGDRPAGMVLTFGDALMELAAERPEVIVGVAGESHRGDLRTVSTDVVTLALGGDRRDTVHLALGAIDHVVVLRR
ncbi:MAG: hypothetical protein AAGE98_02520 [Actinomycetota bacterium]